ncbi:MAG: hypothetical protein ACFE0Q_18890 [Anaerolineae bacterium]
MRLQASLPETLSGQNVTVLLFGGTTVRSTADSVREQAPPERQFSLVANTRVNVRALPTTNALILGSFVRVQKSLPPDAQPMVIGYVCSLKGKWGGWLPSCWMLTPCHNCSWLILMIQAFYLSTGIGRPTCNEVPDDGMLQTPQGVGAITLNINGVDVDMGSTVYFTIDDERFLNITPVEGAARIDVGQENRTAVAGTRIRVALDSADTVIIEDILPITHYNSDAVTGLPVSLFERQIEINTGLNDEDFQLFTEYELLFQKINVEHVSPVFDYLR